MKLNILQGPQESDDYPYGRQKCHITFDVEFRARKGYRYVTQTTNPKTGRVNKPKKSTYSDYIVLHRGENARVENVRFDLRGYDDIAHFIQFLTVNDIVFTPEESRWMWVVSIACIRNNAMYTRRGEGVTPADLLAATRVKRMIELYSQKQDFNQITTVGYDINAIRALCA